MTIDLTSEQEQPLRHLALNTDRTPEEILRDCLLNYLQHVVDLSIAVREGEESAEHEWLTHEEIFERIHSRFAKAA